MLLHSGVLRYQPPLRSPSANLADGGDAGLRVVKRIAHQAGTQTALRLGPCTRSKSAKGTYGTAAVPI